MARGGLGLGNGLSNLFEQNAADPASGVQTVRITEIEQNRSQPRKHFDDEALTELAESIQAHGMLQPIVVRPIGDRRYQIVAGERRWRAAKRIGLSEVPVIIREMSDTEASQIAMIENLQRENLSPIEEAIGYQALMQQFHMTQEEVAKTVGRSRPAVANSLRLLNLPILVQEYLEKGKITVGHAKALAGIKDEQLLLQCAAKAAADKITVRDIEAIAQKQNAGQKGDAAVKQKTPDQIYYEEMEISLGNHLGRRVQVQTGKKKGTLTLEFYNKEDLQALCQLLTKEEEN
ncbi:MAG: ParB/RepB/Spo0J family partition protein [Oscillospiraceae bacterium]|nr:ParB/RepB/Spo0J family partition protein [Oscillospiraceae bacterium]